jgi:hypothetical protein
MNPFVGVKLKLQVVFKKYSDIIQAVQSTMIKKRKGFSTVQILLYRPRL